VSRPRKRGRQIELDFAEFTVDKIRQNDFVNQVRDRVDILRRQPYQHVTPTARRLLELWSDRERDNPILFVRRAAAETAIYLVEEAPSPASGKKKVVAAGFIHNDRLVDALNARAFAALNASPGARAHYDELRARGIEHS
jgi:DNA-binding MarR family transcriptional regulator